MQFRYELALQRLTAKIGEGWLRQPPRSTLDLQMMRERVIDLISQPTPQKKNPHKRKREASPPGSESDSDDGITRARFTALTPELQAGAVSSGVAKRLHKGAARIAFTPATGRARDALNGAPPHLRMDLARAIGSNGRVDAPGEKQPKLASLPIPVREMHAALVGRVQYQLLRVPSADEAGLMYLSPATARKLAVEAVAGHLKLADFTAASRSLLGSAAPDKGSLDELREVWALIRVALVAVGEEIYGMSSSDEGVMRVEAKMHATAKSLRISPKDLERWLRRVLESWELLSHDFRLLDGPMPCFKKCTELHDTFITNQSTMASLAQQMKGEILQELKGGLASHSLKGGKSRKGEMGRVKPPSTTDVSQSKGGGEANPGGGKSGDKGAKRPGKKRKEGSSAWPEMPKMGKEDYAAFRKEVGEAFPDGCIFFLASRCSKGSECQRAHEVPAGYDAIKARYSQE